MDRHQNFLALDPGSHKTGYVLMCEDRPLQWGDIVNEEILPLIERTNVPLVVEFPYPRGQTPSYQLFETCRWVGRFEEAALRAGLPAIVIMDRDEIKKHVAGSRVAKDVGVRKALIERFGGEGCIAKGKCLKCKGKGGQGRGSKRALCEECKGSGNAVPGLLSSVKGDVWAALAVGVTYHDLGPSKSAETLQVERKIRKADQRQREMQKLQELGKGLEEVSRSLELGADPKLLKSQKVIMNKIDRLQKKLKVCTKTSAPQSVDQLPF